MACLTIRVLGVSLLALVAACGGRTALEDGPGSHPNDGEGGAGTGGNGAGAGLSNYDPDVECPLVACEGGTCEPAVIASGHAIGWLTVDGGDIYFTTDDEGGNNALIRVPVCGGEQQVLIERERFAGEGAIVGDDLYIPVEEPAREVLRMPKVGGAATVIHTHDASDPYVTRAISGVNGYILLSQYSFDGGLVLNEINPKGKAHALNDNVPDSDWFLVTSVANGFAANKPVFFTPSDGSAYGALIGSDLGIYLVRPFDGKAGDPVFIEPFDLEVPVRGPLIAVGSSEADLAVYFSSDENYPEPAHYKFAGGTLEPVLPEEYDGIMLGLDEGQIFGSWNDYYQDQYEDYEFGGDVWQATEGGVDIESVFTTRFQNVHALEIHGASVYVRTTRAVVRFPKACQTPNGRCHYYYEE